MVTDRPTDRPPDHTIPSVTIGRIYVGLRKLGTAMWPNNSTETVCLRPEFIFTKF